MPIWYVPILKGKEGEYGALEALSADSKDVILPLIEIPSVPYDYANERPAKTLDDHVASVAERLSRCWAGRDLYLDLPWFRDNEHLENGTVAAARVLRDCAGSNVNAIPTVGTSSSEDYLSAVREYLTNHAKGYCLRLAEEDFDEEGASDPSTQVTRLLDAIEADDLSQGDLILDLGDIGTDVGRATLVARSVLADTPRIAEWRR